MDETIDKAEARSIARKRAMDKFRNRQKFDSFCQIEKKFKIYDRLKEVLLEQKHGTWRYVWPHSDKSIAREFECDYRDVESIRSHLIGPLSIRPVTYQRGNM